MTARCIVSESLTEKSSKVMPRRFSFGIFRSCPWNWKSRFALFWACAAIAGCGEKATTASGSSFGETSGAHENSISPPPLPDLHGVLFADVASQSGLHFTWPQQARPMRALEAFGSGCAAFDADNDGWQDVLLVGEPHPGLFRNAAGEQFVDVTAESGLDAEKGKWTGCAVGDYNGDGLLDLLLTGYHCLALYANRGGFRFEPATAAAGLDRDNHGLWGASAGFMDLNGDGWLDLAILNYVVFGPDSQQYCEYRPGIRTGCTPKMYPPERGEIWRNDGQGRFELVPAEAGMAETTGVALVLAFTDLDGDGLVDFYIGNDAVPADFIHNLGGMRFENVASTSGLARDGLGHSIAAMGADWGDFDGDGRLDLTVTNFQFESFVLFRNVGDGLFRDVSARTELYAATRNRLGFGAKWVDFENDGWLDLWYVNGHVYDNAEEFHGYGAQFRQPSSLFRNERGAKFIDLVPALGADVQRTMVGRGSATLDFNNDGLVDLLAVDFEGPVMLLENRTRRGNHWITLDLRGRAPNLFAHGARVTGRAGKRVWVAEVSPASSYLSSSDPRIHWGLGEIERLESLTIRWPGGGEETLSDVACNRILRLEQR